MQEQSFKTKTVRSLLWKDSVITDIGIDNELSLTSNNPIANIAVTKAIKNIVDCTAFEVFPTNKDIPSGMIDD